MPHRRTAPSFPRRHLILPALVVLGTSCAHVPLETAPVPAQAPAQAGVSSQGETAPIVTQASATMPAPASAPDSAAAPKPDSATPPALISADDMDRRAAELFGSVLGEKPAPATPDSAAAADAGPTWDIDVRSYETFERVRHYVQRFTGPSRDVISEQLSRGTRYEPMIRAKLRAGNLPEDMYYLALVESGFDAHAYSRAAAVGMWQFMTTTARDIGLRVDWWVDERRDPVRSTDAAVRFLRELNDQFGSLYLAAAAYNGGPGRVERGLNRYADDLEGSTRDDMFFALAEKNYLRNETREYVPQLIAAALIAKEPERYGMTIVKRPPFEYDSVRIGPRVPLAAIARASGAAMSEIKDLNPSILRGMTPPKDSTLVRIPPGSRARFDSVFAALPDDVTTGAKVVIAKKNATWESLARGTGVSARAVSTFNPKVKASRKTWTIAQGTPILVPTAAVVAAALKVPDPSVEKYGGAARTYVVRRGDNLSVIAKRYGTTPAAIMRLNGLRKPLIIPGQELLVRGKPSAAKAKPAKKRG